MDKGSYEREQEQEVGGMGMGMERKDGGERAWTELGDRHPDFVYAI